MCRELDEILTTIIRWRLRYLEDHKTTSEEFDRLKTELLFITKKILEFEGAAIPDDAKMAQFLHQLFDKAKARAISDSYDIIKELLESQPEKR